MEHHQVTDKVSLRPNRLHKLSNKVSKQPGCRRRRHHYPEDLARHHLHPQDFRPW